jgi:hypothetical protein
MDITENAMMIPVSKCCFIDCLQRYYATVICRVVNFAIVVCELRSN